ncbi:hypothetical protein NSERUTF1_0925 [Nocardia seriolae]|nr:hypothetical protein NSERUTF1_0925 [Nocardia seriolae]
MGHNGRFARGINSQSAEQSRCRERIFGIETDTTAHTAVCQQTVARQN